jgi:Kef-type K+ transport system membrane component KefB
MVVAASTGANVLFPLFVALVAAKLGDELFKRIKQPAIVGELLAGVIIGPSVLALVAPTGSIEIFAELGVVFLLFWVGLETRIGDLREVGKSSLLVGSLGVAFPFAAGAGLAFAVGKETPEAIFIATALVATSVGITSALLVQLGVLRGPAARTILGAAIVDDILAMILLAVATGLGAGRGIDVLELTFVIVIALAFVTFFALGGTQLMRRFPQMLKKPRFSESPLLPAVILCLGVAALAAELGLAAIIGAFLAGMMVAETREAHPIEEEVAPLYAFFPPFFFVFVGMQVDLGAYADWGTLGLLAVTVVVAVVTKVVAGWIGARSLGPKAALFVGVGMVPRGEVGIVIAGIGLAEGVIGTESFAIVVGMAVVTTLLVPPFLARLGRGLEPVADARAH